MLKLLRIECSERQIYVPVPQEASDYIKSLLLKYGINEKDKLVVIHPGASCPSKIWPLERFSKLVDKLIDTYRVKAIVIGGADNRALFCVEAVKKFMLQEAVFLPNKLNVQQLAALFKKASLFVSNDSGPVHIAVAVNTPVVAIFGRNQPGLSPTRWGPLGPRDIALHKNIGCKICLAHNCKRGFECLKAISVEEVFSSIKDMGILD
jgi:ADP-heptose:LPS heptosyltransferase